MHNYSTSHHCTNNIFTLLPSSSQRATNLGGKLKTLASSGHEAHQDVVILGLADDPSTQLTEGVGLGGTCSHKESILSRGVTHVVVVAIVR